MTGARSVHTVDSLTDHIMARYSNADGLVCVGTDDSVEIITSQKQVVIRNLCRVPGQPFWLSYTETKSTYYSRPSLFVAADAAATLPSHVGGIVSGDDLRQFLTPLGAIGTLEVSARALRRFAARYPETQRQWTYVTWPWDESGQDHHSDHPRRLSRGGGIPGGWSGL